MNYYVSIFDSSPQNENISREEGGPHILSFVLMSGGSKASFLPCSVGVEEVESSGGVRLLSGSVSLVVPEAGLGQRGTLCLL